MTITFPDGVAERIETIARASGYPSAAEFLMKLVEDAEADAALFAQLPGPPGLSPRNRAELESMLDAGLNSGPPIRATPEFWEERKRELEARMAKRKGTSP
jgi:hypothetical protein